MGLLFVGVSVLAAAVGYSVGWLVLGEIDRPEWQLSDSEYVMLSVQRASIYGAAIAVMQWFVLKRLVRCAMRAASGRDPTQLERRLVRNTALWVAVTIAGMVTCGAFIGLWAWLGKWSQWSVESTLRDFPQGMFLGLILGTAQWLVLRRQVPGAGRWILLTIEGMALGCAVQGNVRSLTLGCLMLSPPPWISLSACYLLANLVALSMFVAIYTSLQVVCLMRLAPGWMKRLHERAQKAPADVV